MISLPNRFEMPMALWKYGTTKQITKATIDADTLLTGKDLTVNYKSEIHDCNSDSDIPAEYTDLAMYIQNTYHLFRIPQSNWRL